MITDQEMQRIRHELTPEFNKVFTEVLTKGGRPVVKTGGTKVLIVWPAIVNSEITAPNLMTLCLESTFSAHGGQTPLYVELYASKTGDIITRVVNAEAGSEDDAFKVCNSITKVADADQMLRRRTTILNNYLEGIKTASSSEDNSPPRGGKARRRSLLGSGPHQFADPVLPEHAINTLDNLAESPAQLGVGSYSACPRIRPCHSIRVTAKMSPRSETAGARPVRRYVNPAATKKVYQNEVLS